MERHSPPEPHFPPAIHAEHCRRVVKAVHDELDLSELAELVAQVPPLAARVLQAANSASNGLRRVTDPAHAVRLLGPHRTRVLAEELTPRPTPPSE